MLVRNVLVTYLGQFFITVLGIVFVPYYVKQIGVEAYGLVGFSIMLQGWFSLLDMGMSPTLGRVVSIFKGGQIPLAIAGSVTNTIEKIFLLFGGGVILLAALTASFIASRWLNVENLEHKIVTNSVFIIGVMLAVRWLTSLYRGGLTGLELHVWINKFNVAYGLLRYVLVIPFLYFFPDVVSFLLFQLFISVVEVLSFRYKLISHVPFNRHEVSFKVLRGYLSFTGVLAFTTIVWLVATQLDKLLLSGVMELSMYAYLTLAITAAGAIQVLSSPLQTVLQPRFNVLFASGKSAEFIKLYRIGVQALTVLIAPVSATFFFCADHFLWLWTGRLDVVESSTFLLQWYSLGNSLSVILVVPYCIQFARGDLRLHLRLNFFYILIMAPLIVYVVNKFGADGASLLWAGSSLLLSMVWPLVVNKVFMPEISPQWFLRNTFGLWTTVFAVAAGLSQILIRSESRVESMVVVCCVWFMGIVVALVLAKELRQALNSQVLHFFGKD